MVFLMNNGGFGLNSKGYFTESDLGIASFELPHNTFCAFGITGSNTDGFFSINTFENRLNALIYGIGFMVIEPAEVYKSGVNTPVLKDIIQVETRMSFSDR